MATHFFYHRNEPGSRMLCDAIVQKSTDVDVIITEWNRQGEQTGHDYTLATVDHAAPDLVSNGQWVDVPCHYNGNVVFVKRLIGYKG